MKKAICVFSALILAVSSMAGCNTEKARTYDEIVSDIVTSENESASELQTNQMSQQEGDKQEQPANNNGLSSEALDIEIIGEKVSIPFDFNIILQKGYTFTDKLQEKAVVEGVDKKIPLVVMTNEDEKQEKMYGSPYINVDLYCGKESKDSLQDVTVEGFTLMTVEKKFMSINGFGWMDKTADFMSTIPIDYEEEVGTYEKNITSGEYIVKYNFSDVFLRVYSDNGQIRMIEVMKID